MLTVHVAWGPVAALAGAAEPPALSASERERLLALRSPQRAEQFLAGRWLARSLIAQVHGGTPRDWPLTAGEGPPRLQREAAAPVRIALSHSGPVAACAISAEPVGIDIEAPRRVRDVMALAQLACDEDEQAALAACAPSERHALFHAFWTAKEAWLKCGGGAMSPRRMARIHLRPDAFADTACVRVWKSPQWQLALAAPVPSRVEWHAPVPAPDCAWRVRDEDASPA